ncbi:MULTISPECIES: VRR-NUC domain-containing protein [Campylobacter]|uniref:VRR-NUC domain-containing protein n=1 Tax=Campylobacter vicugnae TaxID=1660076 RepID=A0ABZ2E780_9BACT|nr:MULTISPECIES: VRR-NUC domain-containing protein [unclassified Campylobacter]ARR04567.1 VRR-NUC domain-containing protein [Campylobacter sp. RM12175]MCR8690597.1 VRR-NUC domain-containing protein [Campylobacter sp. RM9264]MCR8701494.1 VRR-NUC domain-containing protein [Campylobacter sp. RM12176]
MINYNQTLASLKAKKLIPLEEQEQIKFVSWLRVKKIRHIHIANERMCSVVYKKKLKALGTYAGFPDLMIFLPNRTLFIEMKRSDKRLSRVSKEQNKWLEFLNLLDEGSAKVCYGADEAIDFVKENL